MRTSNGTSMTICLDDHYKHDDFDEYTNETLPHSHLMDTMLEELNCFNDKVWIGVPRAEARADPEGNIIRTRRVL